MTEIVHYDQAATHTNGALMAHQGHELTPAIDSWIPIMAEVAKLAQHIADTDFVPQAMRGKPAAVAAAILSGREAGVGPMTALQHIHVIKGKPGQSAQLMRQLVLAAGHDLRYIETTDTRCVVEGRRRGEQEWTRVSFTVDQAKKARIDLGGYPEDKLVARATSRLCRRKFADCTGGMPYTIEELEDGDFDGAADVVEVDESADPEPKANRRTAKRRTATKRKTTRAKKTDPEPAETEQDDEPGSEPALPDDGDQAADTPITPKQLKKLQTIFSEHKIDRDLRLRISSRIISREVGSAKELTLQEAGVLIDTLERLAESDDFAGALTELVDATDQAGEQSGEQADPEPAKPDANGGEQPKLGDDQ